MTKSQQLKMIKRVLVFRDEKDLSFRQIAKLLKKDVKQVWLWYQREQ